MADLIATPPLTHAPLTRGGVTLAAWDPGPMAAVCPFPGRDVDAALAPLGVTFPAPGQVVSAGAVRMVWTGRAQAFLVGAPPPAGLPDVAAVSDQSDGWAGLRVSGPAAGDALTRLVALDLRPQAFPAGQVVRTGLNHLPMVLLRDETGFALLVFRSMARSAWHEIAAVMDMLAARARLKVLG